MRTAPMVVFFVLSLAVPVRGQAPIITNHQMNGPSRLEINLGPMPLDQYDDPNCQGGACVNNCPPRRRQSGSALRVR